MNDSELNPTTSRDPGGVTFINDDGSPSENVGSSKGYDQLMAEKAAREGKPVDEVKADMAKPEEPEIAKEVSVDPAAALKAEEFDIGPNSRAALNLPGEFLEQGWDEEQEAQARTWLEGASANAGTAAAVMLAVNEVARADEEQCAAFADKSHSWLASTYGERKDEAIKAAKRVVEEVGGEGLRQYLNETGLGSHPQIVKEFVLLAKKRGYIK